MGRLSFFLLLTLLGLEVFGQKNTPSGLVHSREISVPGLRDKAGLLHLDERSLVYLLNSKQLQRYDGQQWKRFHQRNGNKNVNLSAITTYKNNIWVGTKEGILLKTCRDSLLPAPLSLGKSQQEIAHLASVREWLFIAQKDKGLWMYDGVKVLFLRSFANTNIQAIHALENGLLVATDNGLFEVQTMPENATQIRRLSSEPLISTILENDRHIWVGYQSGGLGKLSANKFEQFALADEDEVDKVVRVGNALWFKDKAGHLWQFEPKNHRLEKINLHIGSRSNRVFDLAVDKDENVWVSTSNGLLLLHPFWTFYNLPGELQVQAIAKLGTGELVAGTDAGCFVLKEDEKWQEVTNNRSDINVLSLESDGQGGLWVGTYGQGLWQLGADGNLKYTRNLNEGSYNSNIFSIEPADETNSWYLGTLGGIYYLNKKGQDWKISPYHHNAGPGKFYIFQLLRDKTGKLWIATDGKGIFSHRNGKFESVPQTKGNPMRIVSSLATDEKGVIWASSPEGHISRLDQKGWQTHQIPFNDAIHIMQPTHNDGVLLGSQNGLWLYQTTGALLFQLDKMYGLPQLTYNTNAMFTEDDVVWIGASGSILEGKSTRIKQPELPEIHLEMPTDLNGSPLDITRTITANNNNLRFYFQIPWYYQSDMLFTRYKLHGLHTAWVETEKREVFLQGLGPGKYELEIQVAFDPDFKKVQGIKQSFEIAKPFYATWWFVLLVSMGLVLLLRQVLHWREQKKLLQNQAEKERLRAHYEILKSQISPHFLFNAFNTLSQLIDVDAAKAGKYVDQLALVFRKVLHFREQDLISLEEELGLVEAYVHLQQQRFENKLRVHMSIPDSALKLMVVPMSVQLLVENAVKHNVITAARPLDIELHVHDLQLTVKNKLQPKKQTEPSTGFGLSSLQSRYRQDFGKTLVIEQNMDYFSVTLPLIN